MAETTKAPQETKGAKGKNYKFVSQNKYLTVSSLGVQFMKGKYETTDPSVAKALLQIDGVDLVEE